jgi:hypothetical protein
MNDADVIDAYRQWVDLLAAYHARRQPVVALLGGKEIVVTVAAVGLGSVTLAPIDGSRRYHCHPLAVVLRDMEIPQ